jgi:alpha-ribazole phosphatase
VNRLYLIRHAETEEAFAGRCVGRLDPGLSQRGREQVAALAAAAPPLSAVYASPLRRALETAEPVAAALGLAVEVRAELCECDFGLLEGLSFAEIEASWPEVHATWMDAPATVRFPRGEAFADVRERAAAFVEEARASPGDAAAVVTHAGVVRAVLVETGGLEPAAAFALDVLHCGVTEVDLSAA